MGDDMAHYLDDLWYEAEDHISTCTLKVPLRAYS
jgi:hypothetical protein